MFLSLTAPALDASQGAVNGVKSFARLAMEAAMEAGATTEEIMETLRVTAFKGEEP